MFVGWRASEVLQSAVPGVAEDGAPCDGKDVRDIDGLEIMVAPGNGQEGIEPSPPAKKVMESIAQLRCFYISGWWVTNRRN